MVSYILGFALLSVNRTGLKASSDVVCNETDIQLVDGVTDDDGRVQVCFSGWWASVCGDYWDVHWDVVGLCLFLLIGSIGRILQSQCQNSSGHLIGAGGHGKWWGLLNTVDKTKSLAHLIEYYSCWTQLLPEHLLCHKLILIDCCGAL